MTLPESMSDHWWWRPGVRPDRRLLVWHILLDDQPAVRDLVAAYQDRLAGIGGLDMIPAEWLHMTTQIVGFRDEIGGGEVDGMVESAQRRLAGLEPVTVELGRLWIHSEAVVLGIRPPRALDLVRDAVRASAKRVRAHQLEAEPTWEPHVSVAYSNTAGPAAPVVEALAERLEPVQMRVNEVHLVEQVRVDRLYRWERRASARLGP
ncbi:2'-5' RNA ligase family protein [Spirillospora albida]|uniref:2'-5' RNA ligase family protein n=1 Tax=Spirillospora albida TaxID=58123 RepID=UPI00068B3DA9|nr:2'-5' RNA ligase family protein [Spirillospora albida]